MSNSSEGAPGEPRHQAGQEGLIVSIDKIQELDRKLWKITKGLPIRSGSIMKVPSAYYARFGIGLTPENRAGLKALSEAFYAKDIEEQLELERLRQQETTEETRLKRDTENKMAWVVAEIVREMMQVIDDGVRTFRICDIGSGRGETAAAIAGELYRHHEARDLLGRAEFHLVDWSPSNLLNAHAMLHKMYGADVYKHEYVDFEDFLGGSEEKCFDFVVSVASFHHKSFPNYLTQIRRALADDGALVSGDWHSAFWHHPYNLYRLLEAVGTEEKRLNALARLFGGLLTPSPGWEPSPEELQAVSDHFDYWRNVHSEVRGLGSAGRARLYMLKANQTSREHADNLQAAEFTTNADDIRKAFQGASLADLPRSLLRGSDFAVVTAAIKKR